MHIFYLQFTVMRIIKLDIWYPDCGIWGVLRFKVIFVIKAIKKRDWHVIESNNYGEFG